MSAGCSQCGLCCKAIGIRYTKRQLRDGNFGYNGEFTLKHWHRISRADALRRNPLMRSRLEWAAAAGQRVRFYECDAFDEASNLCTAHDTRPEVCRGFPFYGRDPLASTNVGAPGNSPDLATYPDCSYWDDVRSRLHEVLLFQLTALTERTRRHAS